ncbi:E3 ubiquitin-protein ligase RNF8 isoform X2 [Ambystoma mexicanum]
MISRTHCFLRQNESGQWTITDNKSLNGVYLNKERVEPSKSHQICEGDQIQLGVPLEDGERAEYEYELIHQEREKVEPFLTEQLKGKMKGPRTKRKYSAHEMDATGADSSSSSKSKALRLSWQGEEQSVPSQRAELSKQPTETIGSRLSAPGPSTQDSSQPYCSTQAFESDGEFAAQADPKSALRDKGKKNTVSMASRSTVQLTKVRETMQEIRKLKVRVQEKQTAVLSVKQQNKKRAQKEVCEMERELQELHDQLRTEQEQQLQRVKQLEKTFYEEEQQLEGDFSPEVDNGLKDQLAQALQEHTLLMEELNRSKKDFEEIIQAKNKELKETMEEKEKVQAQKEEAVNQMNDVLDNELQCIICSEHFIEAVTLNCAHSFCSYCIKEWIKRKVECPICRQEIVTQTRSLVLDNCIQRMVENLSHEMRQHRLALINERKDVKATPEAPVSPAIASGSGNVTPTPSLSPAIASGSGIVTPTPSLSPAIASGSGIVTPMPRSYDGDHAFEYEDVHHGYTDYDGYYDSDSDYENPEAMGIPAISDSGSGISGSGIMTPTPSLISFRSDFIDNDNEYEDLDHGYTDYDGYYDSDNDYENLEAIVSPAISDSWRSIDAPSLISFRSDYLDQDEEYDDEPYGSRDCDGYYGSDNDYGADENDGYNIGWW